MEEPGIIFDREKLKKVVLYICAQCSKEELGNTKLHKILYFSDMMMFLSTGRPLTGTEYIKQKFGPLARHLTAVVRELQHNGQLEVSVRDYYGFPKTEYIVRVPLGANVLSNDEISLLNDVIDYVCSRSAREISEISHDAAWKAADMGERIPYSSIFGMLPASVSNADLRSAIEEARRVRPLIEVEFRAG